MSQQTTRAMLWISGFNLIYFILMSNILKPIEEMIILKVALALICVVLIRVFIWLFNSPLPGPRK